MENEFLHSDLLLLNRISDGDEQAFRELYKRYDALLYPFLKKLMRSEQDAQEIIQETFLRIWLSRDRLDTIEHPKAYIFRSAANISHNWMKRKLVARNAESEHTSSHETIYNTEAQLKARDLQAIVNQIIAEMPEQRRRIYLLHRDQGLKSADIARELDISVSTVKNTLAVAVKNIKDRLGEFGYIISLLLFFTKK